ncbi:DsrE family protein [Pontibacter vulgaris]|uniref:DsrE family protein n=1 Tax=Pontibacter vulgaris TaxID=2905679 RepID=UPI001FA72D92|nr:DsrE family protein [Pontibacter vulgaris]
MKLKLILLLAFIAFASSVSFAQVKQKAAKTEQARQHRIVYDVTAADTALHAGLMRQLNNLKRAWPDAQVEVVVYGKALNLLVTESTTKATAIKDLQTKGVVFAACENTMRARKITKEQLLPNVITVPIAVGELVIKQEEGWSYIKL